MNHICTLTSSVISRGTKFESTKPPHLVVKRLHLPMSTSFVITTKEWSTDSDSYLMQKLSQAASFVHVELPDYSQSTSIIIPGF